MPTRQNPVTRFGGFHGFGPQPKPVLDLSGAKPNAYGPGVDRVPKGSTRYTIGNTGKPLRPGDAAVSPDLVRKYRLKPGDQFTYRGKTYRYGDQSFISQNRPNTNTVEVWYPSGQQPGPNGLPQGSSPQIAAARPRPAPPVQQSAPQPAPKLAGSGRAPTGRSATLTSDPNEDWIGATPDSGPTMRPFDEVAPADNSGSYVDAIYPETKDTTTGFELGSGDYYPETTVAQDPWETQNVYDESGNSWWSQPESQPQMTAADRGEDRSVFGAADTATGQSWDSMVSEQDSHPFEFIGGDNTPTVAEGSYPPPQPEPNFPDGEYPTTQPEPNTLPDTVYEAPPADNLLADEEQPPGDMETDPSLFVRRNDLDMGGDSNNLPSPNLASFGIMPFSPTQTRPTYADVGGGQIDTGGPVEGLQPGEGTLVHDSSFTEAEKQGERETAALRDSGQLPASNAPLTETQYNQQTFGGLRPTGYRETTGSSTGYGQSVSSQENAKLMSFMSFGGNPNRPGPDSTNQFYGMLMRMDNEGGISPVTGVRSPLLAPTTTARSRLLTTAAGRAAAQRTGGHG